jgi:hypothetical protein
MMFVILTVLTVPRLKGRDMNGGLVFPKFSGPLFLVTIYVDITLRKRKQNI